MILQRLLDATPMPPVTHDVDELLAAFERISADRQHILDGLVERPPEIDRELVRELERRHEAWIAAIRDAQKQIGEHRVGVQQLRAYAPAP